MENKFQTHAWHAAVAEVIAATSAGATAAGLAKAIDIVVNHEGTCLLAFHSNARPDVLHHTLEPAGRRHYLDRYLDGPYLLDPLYQLALDRKKPTLCRFRDALPDRFRSSEYYRQYCERTHLLDEVDYLKEVTEHSTVVLVVGRRDRMFTKSEIQRLQMIEPMVRATMQRIWDAWTSHKGKDAGKKDAVHQRLTQCVENFGMHKLTNRERQISQLLLRGHSSKSVARELRIAPGTVMVHKRNLFAKLGISSQYELFSLLLDDLSRSQ